MRVQTFTERCFLVKVSFDSTKHLSDASIKKRQLERQKLQELEQQREEQKRREKEAEQRQRAEERCAAAGPTAPRVLLRACALLCVHERVYCCVRCVLLSGRVHACVHRVASACAAPAGDAAGGL